MEEVCFPEEVLTCIGKRDLHWWIVYNNGVPIAYASAKKHLSYLFLTRVGVLPNFRGNGIQKILIASRLDFAREKGVKDIITYTSKCNVSSIKNLDSFGFEEWLPEEKSLYYGDNFFYWRLSI
jgi:L-amino acid N-acyltransferase YncA